MKYKIDKEYEKSIPSYIMEEVAEYEAIVSKRTDDAHERIKLCFAESDLDETINAALADNIISEDQANYLKGNYLYDWDDEE